MFWSNFWWTFLGAIASIATTVAVEALRRPRLEIRIPETHPIQRWRRDKAGSSREGVPFREATFAYLEVYHKPLPAWAAWLQREPAISCYCDIMFYGCRDLDPLWAKSPEGPGPMPVRWTRAPEPKTRADSAAAPEPSLFDPNDFAARPRMDISPGDAERIDTVAYICRDDGVDEEYFHCWNNENYCIVIGEMSGADFLMVNTTWWLPLSVRVHVGIMRSSSTCRTPRTWAGTPSIGRRCVEYSQSRRQWDR